jgi:glyoxylase-like metal-dependent hydrolase (beta-lactamase superfamily II)
MAIEPLPGHDVTRVRADNPSPLSLDGTNSWLLGRDPCWVVDPGPTLPDHLDELEAEIERRGGVGGIALTHGHADHAEGVPALRERTGHPPVAAAAGDFEVRLEDGAVFGPLVAIPVPGHAPDHLTFVAGAVCCTGDAVLGTGSVLLTPAPGAVAGYLAGLRRLRAMPLDVLCPGHGPPVMDPGAKLDECVDHRLDRERRLVAALERGLCEEDDLLDAVWEDAPAVLRPAAALTLRAHLQKLHDEGRLPSDMEPPAQTWPGLED